MGLGLKDALEINYFQSLDQIKHIWCLLTLALLPPSKPPPPLISPLCPDQMLEVSSSRFTSDRGRYHCRRNNVVAHKTGLYLYNFFYFVLVYLQCTQSTSTSALSLVRQPPSSPALEAGLGVELGVGQILLLLPFVVPSPSKTVEHHGRVFPAPTPVRSRWEEDGRVGVQPEAGKVLLLLVPVLLLLSEEVGRELGSVELVRTIPE